VADDQRSILVVGASAAGLRCACRLTRLKPHWTVKVVEARTVFSYAACGLPYALSGDVGEPETLRRTDYGVTRDAEYFDRYKGVEVLAGYQAVKLDVERRMLVVRNRHGSRENLVWDDLVLATGASPLRLKGQPDHPDVVTFHTWEDLEPLKRRLAVGGLERVALVGAGLVGCELAEAFRSTWGAEVVLIEAKHAPLPRMLDPDLADCVAQHLRDNGVTVLQDSPVKSIRADGGRVELIAGGHEVEAQAAVVAIGVGPETKLARQAGLERGPGGAIVVDRKMATSVPHVWAVGDCATVRHAVTGEVDYVPLGSLANRQGRTLANILAGRADEFPPVTGALAVKVFDWNVATSGCTEQSAIQSGLAVQAAWISTLDRPHYWPEAEEIHLKLIYDEDSGRVHGVQAAGKGEVAKRIDVATQLIARGATLDDFIHLEHAYAPPYAPALDPLAVAAMVAQNQRDGIESVSPEESWDDLSILDVRSAEDAGQSPAAPDGVVQIPLGELDERAIELDDTEHLVVCARGTRSAEATRVLARRGVRARYLGGGLSWRTKMGERDEP
jgi:NADPH-dependent 2,4-dienoyl-CoA reductase/sulfur reductase-like enzyme/rhodanese-related sulfurtransferase